MFLCLVLYTLLPTLFAHAFEAPCCLIQTHAQLIYDCVYLVSELLINTLHLHPPPVSFHERITAHSVLLESIEKLKYGLCPCLKKHTHSEYKFSWKQQQQHSLTWNSVELRGEVYVVDFMKREISYQLTWTVQLWKEWQNFRMWKWRGEASLKIKTPPWTAERVYWKSQVAGHKETH